MITLNCTRLMIRYTFQSHLLQQSIYICRTYKFLTSYFSHCAVWILCAISLERAIVTRQHVWTPNVFSRRHSYGTLITIYTVLCLLNSHYLIFFGSKQEQQQAWPHNETMRTSLIMCTSNSIARAQDTYEYFLIYYFSWIDFLINSLIPFVIILVANINVIYAVCKSHVVLTQLSIRHTRSPRDTQLAYILFVSTFLFLLLTFPLRVFSVIEPYLTYEKKYLILLDGIMRFLLYLDHGFGFYLYTFTGELFRRELRKCMCQCVRLLFGCSCCRWVQHESRRQSELSCSHEHLSHHGNLLLKDSISSGIGTLGGATNGYSAHSLHTPALMRYPLHRRCARAKPHHLTSRRSTSSCRSNSKSSMRRQQHSSSSQDGHDLVTRHSSSCFDSMYRPLTLPCISQTRITTAPFEN